jgi:hypothetical protein
MADLQCEFFASEDGEPMCAFAWGDHSALALRSPAACKALSAKIAEWDFDPEVLDGINEALEVAARPLWVKHVATIDDRPIYDFCERDTPGAIRITGWVM